ncbi:ABC transporter ATP-binding protein [Clostridium chrysemydis]|uniref:ABC transporter ATP-binding protein n=1 Tax=Clostridium chrysemydis TaxID=2665504 RepID=UPI003F3B2557
MCNLKIKGLSTSYGDKEILEDVNLELEKGKFTVLLGLNGAGKTTLLKSIVGLMKKVDGEIYIEDKDLKNMNYKDKSKLISYIPQNIHTSQDYLVEDIVIMGITPHLDIFEMPSKEHYKRVDEILKELNIYHLKGKNIGNLSGGERRLVYLARILIQRYKVLLLDEPNTFLDYVKQYDFFNFLKSLIKEKNLTTLITLHDINLALRYADKIVILNHKKVIDTLDCSKEGYEKILVNHMEKIYEKDLKLIYTEVSPMIIL